eukprot:COSAG06_NODE_32245_length_509_cov_0.804878_1_plen_20_part_01
MDFVFVGANCPEGVIQLPTE